MRALASKHDQSQLRWYLPRVRIADMRKIAILCSSAAGALIMGLVWTVGQTGLSSTNSHLCELFSRYVPGIAPNCQASDWIVTAAGYLSIAAVLLFIIDVAWIIYRSLWPHKTVRQTADLAVIFRPEPPYETTEITNGQVLSHVRIGLKAYGKAFPNCRVYIEKIAPEPPLLGGLPIQLVDNVPMLRPDDPETLIGIATHWNNVSKYRFSAPLPWSGIQLTYIDDEPTRFIEIKVSTRVNNSDFAKSALFRIWVDQSKKLHLEHQQ